MTGVAVVFLGLALGLTEVHRGNATARESRIVETAFYSHAVEGPMRMSVYLPAGYAKSHKRYPVVYFLHGLPASTSSYRSIDFLRTALDAAGRPAILVSAQGARDNDTDPEYHDWGPGRNWETAAGKELPRFVDAHFRTIPNRRGRALVGLSAGGYGAVLVGLHHLGTFSVVESWSGYFHPTDRPDEDAGRRERGGSGGRQRAHVRGPAAGRLPRPADVPRLLRRPWRRSVPHRECRARPRAGAGPGPPRLPALLGRARAGGVERPRTTVARARACAPRSVALTNYASRPVSASATAGSRCRGPDADRMEYLLELTPPTARPRSSRSGQPAAGGGAVRRQVRDRVPRLRAARLGRRRGRRSGALRELRSRASVCARPCRPALVGGRHRSRAAAAAARRPRRP